MMSSKNFICYPGCTAIHCTSSSCQLFSQSLVHSQSFFVTMLLALECERCWVLLIVVTTVHCVLHILGCHTSRSDPGEGSPAKLCPRSQSMHILWAQDPVQGCCRGGPCGGLRTTPRQGRGHNGRYRGVHYLVSCASASQPLRSQDAFLLTHSLFLAYA